MTTTLVPTNRLVAAQWIRTITGLTADGVGNQLPADQSTWGINGYIVVPSTVGGTPHSNIPVHRPVCQVDCWATNPSSDRIPWGKAEQLTEQVRRGAYDRQNFGRPLTITNGDTSYGIATVKGATMLTEPRQIWSDAGDYGGFSLDLLLHWVAAGESIP